MVSTSGNICNSGTLGTIEASRRHLSTIGTIGTVCTICTIYTICTISTSFCPPHIVRILYRHTRDSSYSIEPERILTLYTSRHTRKIAHPITQAPHSIPATTHEHAHERDERTWRRRDPI